MGGGWGRPELLVWFQTIKRGRGRARASASDARHRSPLHTSLCFTSFTVSRIVSVRMKQQAAGGSRGLGHNDKVVSNLLYLRDYNSIPVLIPIFQPRDLAHLNTNINANTNVIIINMAQRVRHKTPLHPPNTGYKETFFRQLLLEYESILKWARCFVGRDVGAGARGLGRTRSPPLMPSTLLVNSQWPLK